MSQNIIPSVDSFLSGVTSGFTDRGVAYIDDVAYLPLLDGIPSLAQQADLKEYEMRTGQVREQLKMKVGAVQAWARA